MCGKFAAQASWAETTRIIESLTGVALGGAADSRNDHEVTYRVMSQLPVIVWDRALGLRRIERMRWGFPHRDDPRRPDPIHARAETIDSKPTFRDAFHDGQRGIVLVKSFNEAPDKGPQHVIMPNDAPALGLAMLWRRFGDLAMCVMVTVPANDLIATLPTDRMPAVLAPDDWAVWLGEEEASSERVKSCLRTMQGERWTMTPEQRAAKPRRRPTVSDPGGLF
ncbi:MAG: SOS response-associated peptidase family protein [Rhizomicrobium sp.]